MAHVDRKSYSIKPAGYLLNRFSLLILAAGLLLAAWFGNVLIVIILGILLSSAGLARLWSHVSLTGVSCQRELSQRRVFPGESIELRLNLINRKLLPLPWIQLEDELPLRLSSDISLASSEKYGYGLLTKSASLLWYTSISWKEKLICQKRGYYQLGPVTLSSGDIFGFYPCYLTEQIIDYVIVYPRIFPLEKMGIPSLYFFGDMSVPQRIFEDPLYIVGVRNYSPRDSLRFINWKATARRRELQVKIFEPTTAPQVALFLSIDGFTEQGEVFNDTDFEMAISSAASIANDLIQKRNSVGIFVNSRLADTGKSAILLPGSGTEQLTLILEYLAKVTATASISFETFLQAQAAVFTWGTTLIVILRRASPRLIEMLIGLQQNGYKLLVLQTGEEEDGLFYGGLPWQHINNIKRSESVAVGGKE